MKPQSKDFTPNQAIEYICKKLNTKAYDLNINHHSFYTKRLSTLKRIEKLVRSDIFVSKYSNNDAAIDDVGHYYLDFWIKDKLVTVRCNKR